MTERNVKKFEKMSFGVSQKRQMHIHVNINKL
jgi:hypothetical protein